MASKLKRYIVTCGFTGRRYFVEAPAPGTAKDWAGNTMLTQPSPIDKAQFVSAALVDVQEEPFPDSGLEAKRIVDKGRKS